MTSPYMHFWNSRATVLWLGLEAIAAMTVSKRSVLTGNRTVSSPVLTLTRRSPSWS